MQKGRKSPLKGSPLRNPGQSLDEKIQNLIDDEGTSYLVIAFCSIFFALHEWWGWYFTTNVHPIWYTFTAIAVTSVSAFKIYRLRINLGKLRQGRDGEKAVGQFLDNLKSSGYRVFHDIVGDGFNIDHVVICEHGVFTIETKTHSKPASGEAKIIVKGESININGYQSDKVVTQARAGAGWLQAVLQETTGRSVKVHPVILFPGWYVDSINGCSDIWILNPKGLASFIATTPKRLSREEVMLLTYNVSRYIRTH